MKKLLCISIIICMILAASITVMASEKMTTAYKGTPKVDGDIDDIWEFAEKIEAANFKTGAAGEAGECKLFARTLWDEAHLYILFEVTDPVVTIISATEWEQDSIEFYVDEDNSKSGAFDGINDIQIRVNAENYSPTGEDRLVSAVKQTDTGYIVEAQYNFIDVMPTAGGVIGFDIQVNDDADDSGIRAACLGWSDEIDKASSDSTVWGNLTFSKDPPPAPIEVAPTPSEAETELMADSDNPITSDMDIIYYVLMLLSLSGIYLYVKKVRT